MTLQEQLAQLYGRGPVPQRNVGTVTAADEPRPVFRQSVFDPGTGLEGRPAISGGPVEPGNARVRLGDAIELNPNPRALEVQNQLERARLAEELRYRAKQFGEGWKGGFKAVPKGAAVRGLEVGSQLATPQGRAAAAQALRGATLGAALQGNQLFQSGKDAYGRAIDEAQRVAGRATDAAKDLGNRGLGAAKDAGTRVVQGTTATAKNLANRAGPIVDEGVARTLRAVNGVLESIPKWAGEFAEYTGRVVGETGRGAARGVSGKNASAAMNLGGGRLEQTFLAFNDKVAQAREYLSRGFEVPDELKASINEQRTKLQEWAGQKYDKSKGLSKEAFNKTKDLALRMSNSVSELVGDTVADRAGKQPRKTASEWDEMKPSKLQKELARVERQLARKDISNTAREGLLAKQNDIKKALNRVPGTGGLIRRTATAPFRGAAAVARPTLRAAGTVALPGMAALAANRTAVEMANNPDMGAGEAFGNVLSSGVQGLSDEIAGDYAGYGGGEGKGALNNTVAGLKTAGENLAQGFLSIPALIGEGIDLFEGVGRGIVNQATTGEGDYARAIADAQGGGISNFFRDVGKGLGGLVESRPDRPPEEDPAAALTEDTEAENVGLSAASDPIASRRILSPPTTNPLAGPPSRVEITDQQGGTGAVDFIPGGGLSQAMARARDGGGGTFSVIDGTERRANAARLDQVLAQGQRMIRDRDRQEQIRKLTRQTARGGKRGLAAAAALEQIAGLAENESSADARVADARISAEADRLQAERDFTTAQTEQYRKDTEALFNSVNKDPEDKEGNGVISRAIDGDKPARMAMSRLLHNTVFAGLQADAWGFLSDEYADPLDPTFLSQMRYDGNAGMLFLQPEFEATRRDRNGKIVGENGLAFDTAVKVSELEDMWEDYGIDEGNIKQLLRQLMPAGKYRR